MSDQQAWKSRQHETVTTRNRKGATSQRVTHYGTAQVSGQIDRDAHGDPLLAAQGPDSEQIHSSTAAARSLLSRLDRSEVRRRRFGLSSYDVSEATRDAYESLIPPLLGTEVRAYQQDFHGDRSDYCAAAYRTAHIGDDVTAMASDPILAAIVEPDSVYATDTGSRLSWPDRELATMGRPRDSERPIAMFRVDSEGAAEHVTELLAPALTEDRIWRGFNLTARGPMATDRAAATARMAARTIGTVDKPTTLEGLETLLDCINRGERVTLVNADGTQRTVTRSADGRYSSGPRSERVQARTASAMALKLS